MPLFTLFAHTAVWYGLKPLEILQKRTIRIITFSKFNAHTSPLYAQLKRLKMPYFIVLYYACFMFHLTKGNLLNVKSSQVK